MTMTMTTREHLIDELYEELCAMYDAEDLRNELLLDQIEREAIALADWGKDVEIIPRDEWVRSEPDTDNHEPIPEAIVEE